MHQQHVVVVHLLRCNMKVAFQMDHISSINKDSDSTYMLIKEADRLGFELYHYTTNDLYLHNQKVLVTVEELKIYPEQEQFYTLANKQQLELSLFDMVFIRQDPPFDMSYITNSYILEKVKDEVFFINDPTEIRNAPEKILASDFARFTPDTLIAQDINKIRSFAEKYEQIILKPLYACGGEGVLKLSAPYVDLEQNVQQLITDFKTPIIAQQYLPEIKKGDLRVIIAGGKIMGQVLRVPEQGKVAANFHAGGKAIKARLTKKQEFASEFIGKALLNKNIYFAGLDFIGDYLTEINVTSPTGIQEINRLEKKEIEQEIWKNFLLNYEGRSK